jgi:pimeloyl-ACP methyl ester carboxylesterase
MMSNAERMTTRHFRDRFHIVALDVRGHGESQWSPDGAYTYCDRPATWQESACVLQ